jgi:hypothetical protein
VAAPCLPLAVCFPHPESQTGASRNGPHPYGEGLGTEGLHNKVSPFSTNIKNEFRA